MHLSPTRCKQKQQNSLTATCELFAFSAVVADSDAVRVAFPSDSVECVSKYHEVKYRIIVCADGPRRANNMVSREAELDQCVRVRAELWGRCVFARLIQGMLSWTSV